MLAVGGCAIIIAAQTCRSGEIGRRAGLKIQFSLRRALDGGTINLIYVAEEHTVLVGEVMGFDEANNISYLVGYFGRDYGKSALFANKNVVIDAFSPPRL